MTWPTALASSAMPATVVSCPSWAAARQDDPAGWGVPLASASRRLYGRPGPAVARGVGSDAGRGVGSDVRQDASPSFALLLIAVTAGLRRRPRQPAGPALGSGRNDRLLPSA